MPMGLGQLGLERLEQRFHHKGTDKKIGKPAQQLGKFGCDGLHVANMIQAMDVVNSSLEGDLGSIGKYRAEK